MSDARAQDRRAGLVRWQWSLYPEGHRDRGNLLIHALTNPIFLGGTVAAVSSIAVGPIGLFGLAAMAFAMALQGRGHKREPTPPVPFRGPLDVLGRIFVEQWITFPRFVLSGGFARAWRSTKQ